MKARIATLQQLLPRLADKVMVGCGSVGVDVSLVNAAGGAISSSALSTTPLAKLPTVDAAWDLPIPAELTQRQVQLMLQEANRSQCSAFSNSGSHWAALLSSNAIKLEEEEEEGEKAIKESKGDSRSGAYLFSLLFWLFCALYWSKIFAAFVLIYLLERLRIDYF